MELLEIQNKIDTMLSGTERKIVFWYDEDAEYQEDIEELKLTDGNKIRILTDDNWFETKLLLEERDPDSNYLVYAPFKRPDDRENHLADTFYYSQHFYSDKIVQLCGELGIPVECQDEVKKYKRFWSSGNTQKFKDLQISEYSKSNITLGILCVLAGVRILNFEELLRKIFLAEKENENPIIKKMEYYKIHKVFWDFCTKYYGYRDSDPSVKNLFKTMVITYIDTVTEGSLPKEWKAYVSEKHNDNVVFIKNLMNNDQTKECYDEMSDTLAYELRAEELIKNIPLEKVVACDAFDLFDINIISWIIAKIEDNMLDEKIAELKIPEICKSRIKTSYHYAEKFRTQYLMLYNAYNLIKEITLHEFKPSLKEVIDSYANETYKIDLYYRKFYYYMDKLGLSEDIEKVKDLVENIYTNKYLSDFSYKWNGTLSDGLYKTYPQTKQEEFYESYVKPFMIEDGREGRVIVIISDGFRYECAKELMDNFSMDEKCDARISHMLSVLPSETTLGMASLLPHKEIVIDENFGIKVDGLQCGNSLADREKILKTYVPKSICLQFDEVKNAKRETIREMLQDKDIAYIYHNQIDNRGENMKSENEVFNACQEAIEEIQGLIRRITGYVSATRYLITADHGFIYKRNKLVESDKITLDKKTVPFVNKRYLLTSEEILNDAVISRKLEYLSNDNKLFVTTPKGADIIKAPGGGQNYVHGGSSLLEMIVPVIKVKTSTGKQETGVVNVELSSFTNKVTGIEIKLDFMQMEPVSDVIKGRKLIAFFADSNGSKITYDVPIIANSKESDAKKRVMTEKFTLKSGKYDRKNDYFLILADMDDERKIYHRYKFEIDIAGTF
ncbi:MAG: hypothetical protein PWP67_807 [Clostridium butyricum]|nr:hypothetical protein [Clostridium butyricum]